MIFVCSFTLLFIFSIDVYTCTDFLTRKAMGLLQFHDKPYMFQRSAYWKMPWFMDHPSATAPWNQDTRREAPHLTCDCIHISSQIPWLRPQTQVWLGPKDGAQCQGNWGCLKFLSRYTLTASPSLGKQAGESCDWTVILVISSEEVHNTPCLELEHRCLVVRDCGNGI